MSVTRETRRNERLFLQRRINFKTNKDCHNGHTNSKLNHFDPFLDERENRSLHLYYNQSIRLLHERPDEAIGWKPKSLGPTFFLRIYYLQDKLTRLIRQPPEFSHRYRQRVSR